MLRGSICRDSLNTLVYSEWIVTYLEMEFSVLSHHKQYLILQWFC